MHAMQFAPEQHKKFGAPAVLAVLVHMGLLYVLAAGLGAVPGFRSKPTATMVEMPATVVEKPEPSDPIPVDSRLVVTPVSRPDDSPLEQVQGETAITSTTPIGPSDDTGSGPVVPTPVEPFVQARLLRSIDPYYPAAAIRSEEEGVVVLRVWLSPQGTVTEARVEKTSGFARLDDAALKSIRSWKFAAATRGGSGVETAITVPVRFELRRR
jgi:periplasmic protein TonB